MLFKSANRRLQRLFISFRQTVVGLVQRHRPERQRYLLEPVSDFKNLKLGYTTTKQPPKPYFLPFRETLASFRIDGNDWHKTVDYHCDRPTVFFGLHACDINALNKLDKVLMGTTYPMPYYAAKRKNMFIIGIDCRPQPFCFCRSMGSDTVLHGFDLFITDIGSRYFIEIQSATAFNLLSRITTRPPEEEDHLQYMAVAAEKNKRFTARVDTTDLTKILDMEFHPGLATVGDRCRAAPAPTSAPLATAMALKRPWTLIFAARKR
jgi:hypothetical protein